MDKISPTSESPINEKLSELKQLFPEIFTENKIDIEKLKFLIDQDAIASADRYALGWAGKQNVFKAIQESTTKTLIPQIDESEDFENSKNIFIEGDNLEALKVLQKSYHSKIKMIYIDPPYNTGNDFVYNDKFSQTQSDYEKSADLVTEEGNVKQIQGLRKNSKDGGHFHSNWLNMMYPRLYVARNLLQQDGVIFCSVDDNEAHNLRLIMNEIFGEENFISQMIWEKKYSTSNNIKGISYTHEYILCYVKDSSEILNAIGRYEYTDKAKARFKNPDNDERGDWSDMSYHGPKSPIERPNLNYPIIHPKTGEEVWPKEKSWAYEKSVYEKHVIENRLWWGKNFTYAEPRIKKFLSELEGGLIPKSILNYEDFGTTSEGRADLRNLFGKNDEGALFDNPKPVLLIKKLCEIGTHKDSIIMDFFGGSGTLAQAVMELNAEDGGNRNFIIIQLGEKTEGGSEAFRAGYNTIADIAKERIRRAGRKINETNPSKKLDIGFKSYRLDETNFKVWDGNVKDAQQLALQMESMFESVKPESSKQGLLVELMLKSGIELTAKVETFSSKDSDLYLIGGSLALCLASTMSQELFNKILEKSPNKVILLDQSFAGNDSLKKNIDLQATDAGVELEVV